MSFLFVHHLPHGDLLRGFFEGVSATAVICRASIEAGSSVSDCILHSDRFLRRISELQNEKESHALLREIVLTYVSLNKKSRFSGSGNALVGKAQRYILDNLFSPLSLSDAAAYLGVSDAHLVRIFRAETGQPIVCASNAKNGLLLTGEGTDGFSAVIINGWPAAADCACAFFCLWLRNCELFSCICFIFVIEYC